MSASARSWFAIFLGMIAGVALLVAATMVSGGVEAGFHAAPQGAAASPAARAPR